MCHQLLTLIVSSIFINDVRFLFSILVLCRTWYVERAYVVLSSVSDSILCGGVAGNKVDARAISIRLPVIAGNSNNKILATRSCHEQIQDNGRHVIRVVVIRPQDIV
jgi:hypothetical protein